MLTHDLQVLIPKRQRFTVHGVVNHVVGGKADKSPLSNRFLDRQVLCATTEVTEMAKVSENRE